MYFLCNRKIIVCPRSLDPFYMVSYYMKWLTTSWTHSTTRGRILDPDFTGEAAPLELSGNIFSDFFSIFKKVLFSCLLAVNVT